jgi:putative phosphoribosyl transferase
VLSRYPDRSAAGKILAGQLAHYARRPDVIVLALPRGGVPVAFEVARALSAPLDVFLVRKLGVPGYEELAMGAIATGGVRILNDAVISEMQIPAHLIEKAAERELAELCRRESLYRGDRPAPELRDRTVVLVDDGLATGSTMRAAVTAVRQQRPARVVVAVPVSAPETYAEFTSEVDEVLSPLTPDSFRAVGQWYEDFPQTSDDEVRRLLAEARNEQPGLI